MATKTMSKITPALSADVSPLNWRTFYRAGAAAALLVILTGLLDVFLMFLPGTGAVPGSRTVVDWYAYLQARPFLALRDLGLLNILTQSCSVVVFFALFGAHRRVSPLPAAFALIVVCIGAAVYIANNTGLPMLTLSNEYAAAASQSQKALWAAAGQALLAQEDLTAGAFPGFFYGEIAGLLMAGVAWRGGIFRRWEAGVGLAAISCLLFFNIVAAFIPALYDSVMPAFGAGGGLLSLLWYGLVARRLFQPALD